MFVKKRLKTLALFTFLVSLGVFFGIGNYGNVNGASRMDRGVANLTFWQRKTDDPNDVQFPKRSVTYVLEKREIHLKPYVIENISTRENLEMPKLTKVALATVEKTPDPFQKRPVDLFTIKEDSERTVMLNKHNYVHIIDSKLCLKKHIPILVVVHSASQYGSKRQLIRNTWASVSNGEYTPVVVFMLGRGISTNVSLQESIEFESKTYGDIVQGDFIDTYENITLKHVMAIHWVTTHCNDVRTIVKIDDDVFVDVYKLGNFSLNFGNIQNSLYCQVLEGSKVHRVGKWKVSEDIYPFPVYLNYCEGIAYIMSMEVARKLLKASEIMRFFWIDDVYVTGLLRSKANVTFTKFNNGHSIVKQRSALSYNLNIYFASYMFFGEYETRFWKTFMLKMVKAL